MNRRDSVLNYSWTYTRK